MRTGFSYFGILSASMIAVFSSYAANTLANSKSNAQVIYGLADAQHFKSQQDGQFYIQAATFKHKKNANTYKYQLRKKYQKTVYVKQRGSYYVVIVGPLHKAAEVRQLGKTASVKHQEVKYQTQTAYQDIPSSTAINHFEVIGALGIADIDVGDANLRVTSSEVDKLVPTNNDWNTFAAQLGVGYLYYLNGAQEYSENLQWFPWVEPEIIGYYLGKSTIKGEVWRFENPAFNEMTYNLPFQSTRLMFDTALTIASKRQYSLYVMGGIGNAWNRVGYRDTDNNNLPCADQYLALNTTTSSSFSWELGAGLAYSLNHRVALSLEYLYTDLGHAKIPGTGYTGTITVPVINSSNFNLTSQAALLGLHVAI